MATYRLTIEYEGTRYGGWQKQQNARTVAGEIERAASELAPIVDLGGAGRTDAGVHALAQSAHLRLRRSVDPEALRRDLNDRLPSDIHVLSVRAVEDAFHARHSAQARSYLYQISRRRTAFAKRHVWWVHKPLDLGRMDRAAALLPGRHDFASFCERPSEQASTLVHVDRVEIAEAGSLVLVRLVASHFLWKMVRRLVGALVRAGGGDLTNDDLVALLEGRVERVGAGRPAEWTAPASGLFLERVLYDGDPPLPPIAPAIPVAAEAEPAGEAPPRAPGRAPRPGAARSRRPRA